MSIAGPGKIIQDGLVLYLDAANSKSFVSGSTTWTDISRNNNSGSLINGPAFNSANGGVISFDGTNDYVSVTNSANYNPSTALTVELWYNSTTTPSGLFYTYCLLSSQQSVAPFNGIDIRGSSATTLNFAIAISSAETFVSLGTITANQWTCVAVTYNGSALNGYRNGVLVQSTSKSGTIDSTNKDLWIGNNPSFSPRYYSGQMSALKIYNRALSATEVLQNYNVEKKKFGLS
jgi:hypothetical protein